MRPGYNYLKKPDVPARPSGNGATVTKYGKKIKMQDFINEAVDGTILNEKIKEQGLQALKGAGVKSDTTDTVIDMGQNMISAMKMAKVYRINENKLREKIMKKQEEMKQKEIDNNGTGKSESK